MSDDLWGMDAGTVKENPEAGGLKTVRQFDVGSGYDFDEFIIWQVADGERYYWAQDSGCSCPVPFDRFRSLDDLHYGAFRDALVDLKAWADSEDRYCSDRDMLPVRKYLDEQSRERWQG